MRQKMYNFFAFFDSRPILTGAGGVAAGTTGWLINHLKLIGDVASPLAVIFGCVAAFFSMLLVCHKFFNRNQK